MRARFGLSEAHKDGWLEFEFSGETEVFLNGTAILNGAVLPPGKHAIVLGKNAKLHTGVNTIAVRTTAQSDTARIRVFKGKPTVQSVLERLSKAGNQDLESLNRLAKKDVASALKSRLDAWHAEATRAQGISLSAVTENTTQPAPLAVHRRGSPHVLGEPVEPAFPAALTLPSLPQQPVIHAVAKRSSGRRLALARWMTDPANPLLSRVAVNRIWQHHFGRGIVPSSNDFGRLGEQPSHPELLDWLAGTFITKGWSTKAMHKLLMTSEAYQQSSANSDSAASKDPENKLLWRYPMRRLTAEELRDSILSIAGILQLKTYGPPVYPPLPRAVLETQSRPGSGWPQQSSIESARRSVYVHVKRSLSVPLLADHDQAATDTPCAMRFVSTVPTQALGMLNSDFMNEHARLLATRLEREAGTDTEKQIQRGLLLALQRNPKPSEIAFCKQTLEKFQSQ
jgi:hypothetical protein